MGWTVEYNSTLQVVDAVFAGKTTFRDLQDGTTRAIFLTKEHSTKKVIIDTTEIETDASVVDLLELPSHQYEAEHLDVLTDMALLLPVRPKERDAAYFYETACINRGWQVRSFSSRDDAMEWLGVTGDPDKQASDNSVEPS